LHEIENLSIAIATGLFYMEIKRKWNLIYLVVLRFITYNLCELCKSIVIPIMNTRLPFILLFLCVAFLSKAQEQLVTEKVALTDPCKLLLSKKLDFLIDGSFQDEPSLRREMARLKECGLDDFDVNFFGRMESMSAMLRKMTKDKQLEQMTFKHLFVEINKMKATSSFTEVKKITLLSKTLATRKGNLKNWNRDVVIFQELDASRNVIAQVFEYLESHPENTKTYQEILESLKK